MSPQENKQEKRVLAGAGRGLLVKGDHNAFIMLHPTPHHTPRWRGGRQGQPMLWHVNSLFPPNQSAEVGMFYFSRHVSAWV